MNKEDVICMARKVGAGEPQSLYGRTDYIVMTAYDLERFAALVADAEREACAKVCEEVDANPHVVLHHAVVCAASIRAKQSIV